MPLIAVTSFEVITPWSVLGQPTAYPACHGPLGDALRVWAERLVADRLRSAAAVSGPGSRSAGSVAAAISLAAAPQLEGC